MSDSIPLDRLTLVREALFLVSNGQSEKSAVTRVCSTSPELGHERSAALATVVDAVSKRDMLDRAVQSALPDFRLDRRKLALFHLTAYLLLGNSTSRREVVRGLRRISSDLEGAELEYLMGSLVAHGRPEIPGSATEEERVGFQTHNPPWWVSYCFYQFGRVDGFKIISPPPRPRYIRINPLKNRGRISLPSEVKKYSIHLIETGASQGVYVLDGSLSVFSRYFSTGLFQSQDLASFLAVRSADPTSGENVLDLCAAPGAKTATLAQLMKNRGTIVSVDYSKERMGSWSRETERLGVKVATPLVSDASNLGLHGEFDLVLVDPPCSGTGILDRNPRMKWYLSTKSVNRFSLLQTNMLKEASKLTRPGGRILYCTCSLTLEENELVVSKFLSSHPEFETSPILEGYGSPGLLGQGNCRRFYPHRDKTAGYFIARLNHVA